MVQKQLVQKPEKEGITYQSQAERRWLSELLANEKVVTSLLEFLKTTVLGEREGYRVRADKWPSRRKLTQVDSGEYYLKVAVKHGSKIKQTWKRMEHKSGKILIYRDA